jgi:hypothetical protein
MMKLMQAVSLVSAMALFGHVMADELQICAPKKRGSVRIAPKCNKNETALVVPVAARGATTSAGTTVVDANGQKLGLLLRGDPDYVSVYNQSANFRVGLRSDPVDPTVLRPDTWNTESYAYASADCSGEPLRVFHVYGDGSVTPNGLDFWRDRSLMNTVYAEATTDEATRQEVLSGRYLTLGGQVAKQVNPTDDDVAATTHLIGSVKGAEFVEGANGLYPEKPSGCTPLTVTSEPGSSQSPMYGRDYNLYQLYRRFNEVGSKSTRWVFTYANAQAPFPSPVKLPLSFQ